MNFTDILHQQNLFFRSQSTKNIQFRKDQLQKLKSVLQQNEKSLYEAIYQDFGKSEFDTFTTELSLIYGEIDYYVKNISKLSKPKRITTNIVNQLGKSKVYKEPFGNCLIIGAWNYPYLLSISPAVAAIAAGNTVILKPSEIAENCAKVLQKIINEKFDASFFHVVLGGVEETTQILEHRFDKIFFTGSSHVGKIVYQAAAKHLTPVTLELGGKSPTIISETADLEVAAKRIVWGKFLNAGQTCIAPDYVLVNEKIKSQFLERLKETILQAKYTETAEHFTKIINKKNFQRIVNMIQPEKVILGGQTDAETLFIAPTLLDHVTWQDPVMQEEIFGPVLPILTFSNFNQAVEMIWDHEKPLAAYLFSNDSKEKEIFRTQISFGGGCINDTLMHIANPHLPFGGVGNSGIGNYHGKYGFDTFSHHKSVLEKATWGEPNWKYPPYTDSKKNILKKIL